MAGIGPNQVLAQNFTITAATTVTTQISDLAALTVGKINFINISFAGQLQVSAGNDVRVRIVDAASAIVYAIGRMNVANSAIFNIPGTLLLNLINMNIPFANGLSIEVVSITAGDIGAFALTIGYDRTS